MQHIYYIHRTVLPIQRSGTVCHTTLLTVCHWHHSAKNWNLFCFLYHFHDYIFLFSGRLGFYFKNFWCMGGGGAVVECPTRDRKVPGSIPGGAKKWMHVCKYLLLLSCVLCIMCLVVVYIILFFRFVRHWVIALLYGCLIHYRAELRVFFVCNLL